jgi:hypothetical protein
MAEAAATIQAALIGLLCEHGLDACNADRLASKLIRDYPVARRFGVRATMFRLHEAGMTGPASREAALELLAFELLGHLPYERVLEIIEDRSGGADPLAFCLRAARLRRELTASVRLHEPRPFGARLVRLALDWLGS